MHVRHMSRPSRFPCFDHPNIWDGLKIMIHIAVTLGRQYYRRTWVKGLREYGDDEDIWTYEGSTNRIMGEGGGKLRNAELHDLYPSQILTDKTKGNEMGGVCGAYGEDEKYKHGSSAKPE